LEEGGDGHDSSEYLDKLHINKIVQKCCMVYALQTIRFIYHSCITMYETEKKLMRCNFVSTSWSLRNKKQDYFSDLKYDNIVYGVAKLLRS
jgi:hypothetical protein